MARSSADTPLMRQYLEVKERHPGCIVFFRVGDFYEMFFDDALAAARALDLTLTTRDKGKDDAVPMCGVPYHAARGYVSRLVEQGFKVAICDQVEDPRLAKGIVRREVTRVVTPGVLVDEEGLEARAGCYLGAVVPAGPSENARFGFAWLDVSTGEFAATALDAAELDVELGRVAPRELLVPPGLDEKLRGALATRTAVTVWPAPHVDEPEALPDGAGVTRAPAAAGASWVRAPRPTPRTATPPPSLDEDRALLAEALGDLPAGALDEAPLRAAAACVRYARATQPGGTLPVHRLVPYRPSEHLVLDETTLAHLEIFRGASGETAAERRRASLLGLVDLTMTSPGGRLLRGWLGAPLVDVAGIRRRHDAVEWLVEHAPLRARVRAGLAEVADLERLAGRAALRIASPRDLGVLRRSLEQLPALAAALAEEASRSPIDRPELIGLDENTDLCADVAREVAATLVDEPPSQLGLGPTIRRGFSPALDELVDLAEGGKGSILAIEARERERTGINSLKIKYNKVFGYYLEITRSNVGKVPADYVRKQTVANAERYTTPELAEYEAKVTSAEDRRGALEAELFAALRDRVAAASARLGALAAEVARLDAFAALAEVAQQGGWVRPDVDDGVRLEIDDGRHPVVERLAAAGRFVPNDVVLDPDDAQLAVVTGPNMAGKSTVMRQVALIVLLGQAGSFVPARRARIGVVDRVFTRVGASDNLARGQSTFMVEMTETAHILAAATRRSLVLLDEIGRGTSTYDGVSIAWAVAEHLHDRVGARTMFATHYHELVALARTRPRARNLQVAVREYEGTIVFLHKLVDGGASRSYGIEVARLAGLPRVVLDRARAVLAALERGDDVFGRAKAPTGTPQMELFAKPAEPPPPDEVREALRAVDPDDLSPREAHALVVRLREKILSDN